MKVYKGTDKNMQCRGYQYEIGKTEKSDGSIRCGDKGFHSCEAPFDVLRYYPIRDGNRYFSAEASGEIDRTNANDSKIASSELTIKAEVGLPELIKAQIEYARKKAESGEAGGDYSNLIGGNYSNLIGGNRSNLIGGDYSNLIGGDYSNIVGGNGSNLVGRPWSNLIGGGRSNLICGNRSNLIGGGRSNLIGGDGSNLIGGDASLIVGRNDCKAKSGKNSVIVLTEWAYDENGEYKPICVKAVIVDGETIKADTWYMLKDGEIVEADE